MPKLGAHVAELERLLAESERKLQREQLIQIRLFEAMPAQGYEGGYDTALRHARRWQRKEVGWTATAFMPLSFEPVEAYQFDWSHEVVVLAGVTTILLSSLTSAALTGGAIVVAAKSTARLANFIIIPPKRMDV